MSWSIVVGVVAALVVLLALPAIPLGRRGGRRGRDGTSRDASVESRRDVRAWQHLGGMGSDDSWTAERRDRR
ncbi:MAG TPA: hypothetical protein VGC06_31250 [Actinomycetes bacterium]